MYYLIRTNKTSNNRHRCTDLEQIVRCFFFFFSWETVFLWFNRKMTFNNLDVVQLLEEPVQMEQTLLSLRFSNGIGALWFHRLFINAIQQNHTIVFFVSYVCMPANFWLKQNLQLQRIFGVALALPWMLQTYLLHSYTRVCVCRSNFQRKRE